MWCCMYPSSFFRFKKLIEYPEIQNNNNNNNSNNNNNNNNNNNQVQVRLENNDYDNSSITNNVEEFKSLFRTQEKLCYELRSENTVLKTKLEMATELNKIQYKKIKKLKFKKDKLKIENAIYEKIFYNSGNYIYNNHEPNKKYIKNEDEMKQPFQTQQIHAYPPPPPPPLPLPPPAKKKTDGNPLMNNVLDELKSRIKKVE